MQMTGRTDKLATIVGGSGFVGRHTVRAMARDGWRMRIGVRRPDLAGHLQPMGNVGQIHAVQLNVRYPQSVRAAMEGATVVVNLAAILSKSGRQTLLSVNVEGPRIVAKAAREAGVETFIHVSALGADPKSKGNYGRSRAAGEAAALAEFPTAIILRPSIVFGPEDEFFNRFGFMAQMAPMLPLIGGGRTKFQPVFVGDLAQAIANAASGAAKPGTIYEIGGPEVISFRQVMDRTQEWTGRSRPYLRMPFWLAKVAAFATVPLPNSLRPLTVDQVRMLQRDNIVSEVAKSEGRTLAGLGVTTPQMISSIVPGYLERFQAKGQFAHYRG
jgi:NADH dehydrogenase